MQKNFISLQPAEKQPLLAKCFENLMNEVEPNLLSKNRDRYEVIIVSEAASTVSSKLAERAASGAWFILFFLLTNDYEFCACMCVYVLGKLTINNML